MNMFFKNLLPNKMVLGINMLASRMILKVFTKGYDILGILINCNMML